MKIIKPSAKIVNSTPDLEKHIERMGRICYKSEDRTTDDSASAFIKRLIDSKHESVLEHGSISVLFIVDRGVSHELVRHRLASFSQESTRYCNYSKDKHGNEVTFIEPLFWPDTDTNYFTWRQACDEAESAYFDLLENGATPQEARTVLPNSLKTEVGMTANPREWRLIFTQRTAEAAHPQMREVMRPLLAEFQSQWPAIFGDL